MPVATQNTSTAEIAALLGISPLSTIHNGYNGEQRTLARMDDVWNWRVGHRWLRKRLLHLWFNHPRTTTSGFDVQGFPILHSPMGNGGLGRDPVQQLAEFHRRHTTKYLAGRPTRRYNGRTYYLLPGMAPLAPPDGSVHEVIKALEDSAGACDQLGWQDHWASGALGASHLQNFRYVNNEEWHAQDAHLPRGRRSLDRALAAGARLEDVALAPIPGSIASPDSPASPVEVPSSGTPSGTPPPMPPFDPKAVPPLLGLWPINTAKPNIGEDIEHNDEVEAAVSYLQAVLKATGIYIGVVDGYFGPLTGDAVEALQTLPALVGWDRPLYVDRLVGRETWRAIDHAANQITPTPEPASEEDEDMPLRIIDHTALGGKFALIAGRWVPWLFAIPEDAEVVETDHALLAEQILVDQGPAGETAWKSHAGIS